MEAWDIIIVGAGIAGVSAARTLADSPGGRVLLVNDELIAPYKRTKLSKHIADGSSMDAFALEPSAWYSEHGITLRTGASVESIDAAARIVRLGDASEHRYESLILSTGAEPLYPGAARQHDPDTVFVVRSSVDVERLRVAARAARDVLIGGMGVLAAEVAAELRSMGKSVTLVGAGGQLMPRHLNARAAEILEELLTSNGVKLKFREEILSFETREQGGQIVSLIRETMTPDLVVLCVGVKPRTRLALEAGLRVNRGIEVDEHLRTSDPHIYAAGDCVEHADGSLTDLWHAAEYQGEVAARNAMAARNAVGEPVVWDGRVFRLKCEVFDSYFLSIGKPRNEGDYAVEEYESGSRYQCFYFRNDALCGAVMVNDMPRAKEYQPAVREGWSRERVLAHFTPPV